MFLVVTKFDKQSGQVQVLRFDDNLMYYDNATETNLTNLAAYTIETSAHPLNYSIDRNGVVRQDVGAFDRLMNLNPEKIKSSSETICSNIILNEVQNKKGKTLGYRVLNSSTLNIGVLTEKNLIELEAYHKRPVLQNGIIRNNTINCYPNHPFLILVSDIKSVNKQGGKKQPKKKADSETKKKGSKTFAKAQKFELNEAKKNGVDIDLIKNPDLSNRQMRVLWMSKKNGARAEAFNKPDYSVDSMKFYADLIYTEKDENDCRGMLDHPELSVPQLRELYDCVRDGVDYSDLLDKNNIDIFVEREHRINERNVDDRPEDVKNFEMFDAALKVALKLKGFE